MTIDAVDAGPIVERMSGIQKLILMTAGAQGVGIIGRMGSLGMDLMTGCAGDFSLAVAT
jgi:hypothetical protein